MRLLLLLILFSGGGTVVLIAHLVVAGKCAVDTDGDDGNGTVARPSDGGAVDGAVGGGGGGGGGSGGNSGYAVGADGDTAELAVFFFFSFKLLLFCC